MTDESKLLPRIYESEDDVEELTCTKWADITPFTSEMSSTEAAIGLCTNLAMAPMRRFGSCGTS